MQVDGWGSWLVSFADEPAGRGFSRATLALKCVPATFESVTVLLPDTVRRMTGNPGWHHTWIDLLAGSSAALEQLSQPP